MMTEQKRPDEWIKEKYLARKSKNPSYSLRAYARDLNVSQTLISLILNGKRRVSTKLVDKMSHYAMLTESEEQELMESVLKAKKIDN